MIVVLMIAVTFGGINPQHADDAKTENVDTRPAKSEVSLGTFPKKREMRGLPPSRYDIGKSSHGWTFFYMPREQERYCLIIGCRQAEGTDDVLLHDRHDRPSPSNTCGVPMLKASERADRQNANYRSAQELRQEISRG